MGLHGTGVEWRARSYLVRDAGLGRISVDSVKGMLLRSQFSLSLTFAPQEFCRCYVAHLCLARLILPSRGHQRSRSVPCVSLLVGRDGTARKTVRLQSRLPFLQG